MKSFEGLEVWQKGTELRQKITALSRTLPNEEKYRLSDQMIRASRSITNNIAEGYGRFHFQETIQFCRQSRGSTYEIIDHLIICEEEGYVTKEELHGLKEDCFIVIKLLNGFIRYLKSRKNKN